MTKSVLVAIAITAAASPSAFAQQAAFVYRLGRDTIAVEQYTRTANRMTGEVVSRGGAAVTRLQYDATLGSDGRPTAIVYRQRTAAGAPLANAPTEVRLTFVGDSVKREAVFADSTSVRTMPAVRGTPTTNSAFGMLEIAFAQMRRGNLPSATFALVAAGAANPGALTLTAAGGDTIRGSDNRVYLVDREGRLLGMDASATTNKLTGTRSTSRVDIGAIAGRMTPTGALSGRGAAHAAFMQSVVFINYGRPLVRERTIWGGELVPYDAIWRTGANEATHLATTRELTFGNVVVPPGLYTLWVDNARSGPLLAINKQVGQWGAGNPMSAVYNPANDVGRVPLTLAAAPQHVEEFTINIRNLGQNRGAIDLVWGNQVASASFTAR